MSWKTEDRLCLCQGQSKYSVSVLLLFLRLFGCCVSRLIGFRLTEAAVGGGGRRRVVEE